VLTWARAHALPHAVCRLGNVYGPRQSPHGEAGVVAILTYQLWSGGRPTLYGHGEPTRDYVHVDDVVRALDMASGHSGVFNIATGVETDVRSLWTALQRAAQSSVEPQLAPLRPGELERSCMDPTRAREVLGWRAEVALPTGVQQTYDALVAEFAEAAAAA
jgi:UDP-glucose 4-epimerase